MVRVAVLVAEHAAALAELLVDAGAGEAVVVGDGALQAVRVDADRGGQLAHARAPVQVAGLQVLAQHRRLGVCGRIMPRP